jgi:membrane protease YdiL (CAAX protease family)
MPQSDPSNYWQATRHPWSCVLFVLPFLAAYEIGVRWLAKGAPEDCRNGADVWMRDALAAGGISPLYGAPALLLLILLGWALWRRQDRPVDQTGVWIGMIVESVVFALVLLALSQGIWYLLQTADRVLCSHAPRPVKLSWPLRRAATPEPALELIVGFLGAGIYEETLFRLVLFSGLFAILTTLADFANGWGFTLAATTSALVFAGAHHLGAHGEPFNGTFFAFRTAAGWYFAGLYWTRGFGIAVGAHAFYDVVVGLLLGAL